MAIDTSTVTRSAEGEHLQIIAEFVEAETGKGAAPKVWFGMEAKLRTGVAAATLKLMVAVAAG